MKQEQDAVYLAELMVETGRRMGKRMMALITDMNQPLGREVGNANEVAECIDVLKGNGPDDLRELSLVLAGCMFYLGRRAASLSEGKSLAEEMIRNGAALEKFRRIVQLQGGDSMVVDDPGRLPRARHSVQIASPSAGFVSAIMCEQVGTACVVLGGGREKKEDAIDPAVGITIHKKLLDPVAESEPLCTVWYNSDARLEEARRLLLSAYTIAPQPPADKPPLVHRVIGE
jgi:pyrimidine-nucleoside phosphorylase